MPGAARAPNVLWLNFLRHLAQDVCLALYSIRLEKLGAQEARLWATRPHIIERSILNPESTAPFPPSWPGKPSTFSLHMYPKEQDTFELSFEAGDEAVEYSEDDIMLLAGGRWIVGSVLIGHRMAVLCWDCLSSLVDGVLHPVISMKGRETSEEKSYQPMSLQYDCAEKCFNISLSYTNEFS
jgi:hypothetical protein